MKKEIFITSRAENVGTQGVYTIVDTGFIYLEDEYGNIKKIDINPILAKYMIKATIDSQDI